MDDFDAKFSEVVRLGNLAWSYVGRWTARCWSLLIAWAITYALLFVAAFRLGEEWMLYALMAPMIIHAVLEFVLTRRYAKLFGEVKDNG